MFCDWNQELLRSAGMKNLLTGQSSISRMVFSVIRSHPVFATLVFVRQSCLEGEQPQEEANIKVVFIFTGCCPAKDILQ